MASMNWRSIDVDAYDPDSPSNFDVHTLAPPQASVSAAEVQHLASQIRQLSRGGDAEGALRGALEGAPYGGDAQAREMHLASVVEILQSIKQVDMSPMLKRIYESPGGSELLDVLMKYLYKGMAGSVGNSTPVNKKGLSPQVTGFSQIQARNVGEGAGQTMGVLLSWHEKVVEVAGVGSIMRVMSDRRVV